MASHDAIAQLYTKSFATIMASVSLPMASVYLPNLEWRHFYDIVVCSATHLIGPIRGNNFLKIYARQSKILPKIGEKYRLRPMDYFFCKVVPRRSYDKSM